jgi:serine/threonine protein kinase
VLSCPSAATLAGLGNDSIEATIGTALEQHIEGCPACRAKLDRLAHNDAGSGATMSLPCPDDPPEIPGFVIERELGRGSMSVVYQARQPSLGRRVALKVVRSGPGAGSGEYARWLREARAFSLVRHDNVVRLYQVGESNGWLYLVLELVRGGTLNGGLDVPYPARDAARLLETIVGAVAATHGAGLLHRDLKPSNILLDAGPETPREQAKPRVGDFGLAYPWDDPEATVIVNGPTGPVGTPRYMAPEQVTGDRAAIGPAADIYGLGALFYHLLTGRPPFTAPSVAETLEQVLH